MLSKKLVGRRSNFNFEKILMPTKREKENPPFEKKVFEEREGVKSFF